MQIIESAQFWEVDVYEEQINLAIWEIPISNDLLDRQSSEQGRDEVTYFYIGDVFGIYLGLSLALCMPIFKKKSLWRFLGECSKLFIVVTCCFLNYTNFPDFSICQIYQFFVDVHQSELSWYNYLRQRLRTEYRKIVYHSQNSGVENAELTLLNWISEFPKCLL